MWMWFGYSVALGRRGSADLIPRKVLGYRCKNQGEKSSSKRKGAC